MIFIVTRHDKPDAQQARDTLKKTHRDFLKSLGWRLVASGAIMDENGQVTGGQTIFQCDNFVQAREIANKDPYMSDSRICLQTTISQFRMRWKDGQFHTGDGYSPERNLTKPSQSKRA